MPEINYSPPVGESAPAGESAPSGESASTRPTPARRESQPPLRPSLIVGLGNPGAEYAATRHNAGFQVIDALATLWRVNYWKSASGALFAESEFLERPILLAKPQQFMNLSGPPVRQLLKKYDLSSTDLLVIHDELDLPAGTLRLKWGGGDAGHKGVRSISGAVGPDYARLRLGLGRPPGPMPADRFVLQPMSGTSWQDWQVNVEQAAAIVQAVLQDGLELAMNHFNSIDAG